MVLNKIQPYINPILSPNQNGKSTISQILALRLLIEGMKNHNIKAIIIFVDLIRHSTISTEK